MPRRREDPSTGRRKFVTPVTPSTFSALVVAVWIASLFTEGFDTTDLVEAGTLLARV